MSVFSDDELKYLSEGGHLGRLATMDGSGFPHVVPLGWSYNAELDTIDIGGRDAAEFAASHKFRNILAYPKVAIVIDDVLAPWTPRCVMIRGEAEAILEQSEDGGTGRATIRITPTKVTSWGLSGQD